MTAWQFKGFTMKRTFIFTILFFSSLFLFGQENVQFPSLEPIFQFEKEELSGEDCIVCGLEFSLCPTSSETHSAILSQFKELESEVTSQEFLDLDEEVRGERILTLMYEKVLKQYSFNQTYIDIMFQKGIYNCVSSSVFYAALAKSAGLNVKGNETPEHAFCTVYLSDGRKIDVETTNPNGFNPGTKKNVTTSTNSTRYYTVPKKSYSNRKEISIFRLVSLVGKNATALLDEKNDYNRSVPEAATQIDFLRNASADEKASARKSFDIATTNYAVHLDRQKKSDLALDWLDAVEARWGRYETAAAQKLYDDIAYNVAVYLPKQGKSERTKPLHKQKKYLESAALLDEGLKFMPNSKNLQTMKNQSLNNYAVGVHNQFVNYYNKKDYENAERGVREGLEIVPNNANLNRDLARLQNIKK